MKKQHNSLFSGLTLAAGAALGLFLMVSCGGNTEEKDAARMLDDARLALRMGRYQAAKDSVLEMRMRYRNALEARTQGILLLDSIELAAAQDSLKSLTDEEWKRMDTKVKFFERKLEEDLRR